MLGPPQDAARDAPEPMPGTEDATAKPRRLRRFVVAAVLLAALGLGGLAYRRLDHTVRRSEPLTAPKAVAPQRTIGFALSRAAPPAVWGDGSAGFPGYPQRALEPLPKPPRDSPSAFMTAMSRVTRATPVVPAIPKPSPLPPTAAAPTPAPAPSPAAVQVSVDPPVSTPLNLQIVYASWGPQAAQTIAALQAKIQGQMKDITTSSASEWPVHHELVIYFFPDDRAAANRVAASLAQITKRTTPVILLRSKSPPRPGTVEILLPLRSGADLKNADLSGVVGGRRYHANG